MDKSNNTRAIIVAMIILIIMCKQIVKTPARKNSIAHNRRNADWGLVRFARHTSEIHKNMCNVYKRNYRRCKGQNLSQGEKGEKKVETKGIVVTDVEMSNLIENSFYIWVMSTTLVIENELHFSLILWLCYIISKESLMICFFLLILPTKFINYFSTFP